MPKKQPAKPRPKRRAAAAARSGGESSSKVNPAAMEVSDLAKLLSRAGGREISAAKVKADLKAGAPANADGTVHLVHYAAWLAAQAD